MKHTNATTFSFTIPLQQHGQVHARHCESFVSPQKDALQQFTQIQVHHENHQYNP